MPKEPVVLQMDPQKLSVYLKVGIMVVIVSAFLVPGTTTARRSLSNTDAIATASTRTSKGETTTWISQESKIIHRNLGQVGNTLDFYGCGLCRLFFCQSKTVGFLLEQHSMIVMIHGPANCPTLKVVSV